MAKRQLTLFSEFATEIKLYSQPKNEYQKFVNMFFSKNSDSGKTKEALKKSADKLWKEVFLCFYYSLYFHVRKLKIF